MTGQLAAKTIIITGGGRGYGMHMAYAVTREGANVVLASRTVSECEAVAADIEAMGGSALAVPADVTDDVQVQAMVDAARSRFGPVDILINNAGHPGRADDFLDLTLADWHTAFDANVMGSVICSKAVLPDMIERGAGHIVQLSSLTASLRLRGFRSIPYTVSKFAIEGLAFTMSVKLEQLGIRVNAFVPGLAHTRFLDDMPLGFLKGLKCQTVDHVEGAIVHLLAGGVPTGDSFDACAWLDNQGLLEKYSYIHD